MMTADSSGPVRSGTLTSDLACANCLLAFTSPLQQLPIRKGVIENKFFLGPVKFVRLILRCLVVSSGMDRRVGMKLFMLLFASLFASALIGFSSVWGSVSRDNAKVCSRDQKDSFKDRSAGH